LIVACHAPKPVEIRDPLHPFSVKTDYPAIYNVFISKGITMFGNYTKDDKSWTKKPPFTQKQTEQQDRRQWVYREINAKLAFTRIDLMV
jgi:hypothetical protein